MGWVRFTLTGLIYALVIELEYKLFVRFNPQTLFATAIFYLLFLQYLYLLHRLSLKWINKAFQQSIIYFLLSGFSGLFILEWSLVGNTSSGNPNASQTGMFIFHACYPFMAKLYAHKDELAQNTRRRANRYFFFAILATLPGLLIGHDYWRFAWFIYAPLVAYTGLWYFFFRYIKTQYSNL